MSAGRTSWWPCDAAEHDRELNVELGEEFGPGGPHTIRVLKDLAQAQRDGGRVKTGFRILRTKTHVADVEQQRAIVAYAARIGAIDDLELHEDGRRFTCRISGWEADQTRGREAIKKADQRAGRVPPTGDTSTSDGDVSGSVPLNREEQRGKNPPTPLQGERPVPPAAPIGGRKRDRAVYEGDLEQHQAQIAEWAPHRDELNGLAEWWGPVRERLRESVTESTWAANFSSLHPHREDGGTVVLACLRGSLSTAHQRLVESVCDRPVFVVPCPHSAEEAAAA